MSRECPPPSNYPHIEVVINNRIILKKTLEDIVLDILLNNNPSFNLNVLENPSNKMEIRTFMPEGFGSNGTFVIPIYISRRKIY